MRKSSFQSILLNENIQFSHQRIWSLYLDSIDFFQNQENISIDEKSQISEILIRKFKIETRFNESCQNPIEDILKPIFECLFYLLNYCFLAPFQKWTQRNFARIICMLMVLGWNIPKTTLQDWKHFFMIQLGTEDYAKVLLRYLEYMFVDQIYKNHYFTVPNTKCIKDLESHLQACMMLIKNGNNQPKSLQGYYKAQGKSRKISDQNKGNIKVFNIFLLILQIEENHGTNFQLNQNQVIKHIGHLNESDFRSKSMFRLLKRFLWSWIAVRFGQKKASKQHGFDVFQKEMSQTLSDIQKNRIDIFSMISIQKIAIGSNFKLLKERFQNFDKTINCPIISENLLIGLRLILAQNMKDSQEFSKIIKKVNEIKDFKISDLFLFEQLATVYIKIVCLSFEMSFKETYAKLIYEKLQPKIHDFIMFFEQLTETKTSLQMKMTFSLLLMRINSISNGKNSQNSIIFEKSKLYKNHYAYLDILERLAEKFPSKVIVRNFIIFKVNVLYVDREASKLVDFMQNEKRLNLSNLNACKSDDQTFLLISYYISKVKETQLSNGDPLQYRMKLAQIYQTLAENDSRQHIFKHLDTVDQIVAIKYNHETIIAFFKTATEHVTKYPSKVNYKYLISFLIRLYHNYQQRFEKQFYDVETGSSYVMEVQSDEKQQELNVQLCEIFDGLKKLCDFTKPWQNPYLIMICYLNASLVWKDSNQLVRLQSLIPKAFDYLQAQARQLTLAAFYYMQLLGRKVSARKKAIFERKLYKAWSNVDELEKSSLVFDLPPPSQFSLGKVNLSHKAGEKIKDKMYTYFENMEVKNVLLIKPQKTKRQPMQSRETGNIHPIQEIKMCVDISKLIQRNY